MPVINDDNDLVTRPAVVVGGASGIGLEVVRQVSRHTDAVGVIDLSPEPGDALRAVGDHVSYHQADVLDPTALEKAFAALSADQPVANVFVSAGVTLPGRVLDVEAAAIERCLMINLMGSINTIRAAVPCLATDASIVLAASVAAYTGGGYVGGPVYGATKAGVMSLTRGTARELAENKIRVNCVAPGATHTGMVGDDPDVIARLTAKTLLGRLANPLDIANAVLFLWSSSASYLTGTTIDVNGGSHLG
ncbi:SDR family oxidoreductase [Amycolatopsis sp. La24]|uniref:SDR family NAD(P)-dependent oxidoreductase n=1 Tax=Amycolatopsis sp. La24 TaxID=3028304 RepID=UPI0023B0EA22|nr:SDR family oxidoreductase [Amycolatopsis sp. La24]